MVLLSWARAGVASPTFDPGCAFLSYIGVAARGRTGYWLRGWGRWMQAAYVLLQSTVLVFRFIVTVVFWALLSSPDNFSTTFSVWSNASLHALNSAFALLELLLTNVPPVPLLALPVQILLLAGYLGVAYVTKPSQGFYRACFS
ncbi:hypothetical protein FB451DRAFT_1304720, partial [Mycena latifolia]